MVLLFCAARTHKNAFIFQSRKKRFRSLIVNNFFVKIFFFGFFSFFFGVTQSQSYEQSLTAPINSTPRLLRNVAATVFVYWRRKAINRLSHTAYLLAVSRCEMNTTKTKTHKNRRILLYYYTRLNRDLMHAQYGFVVCFRCMWCAVACTVTICLFCYLHFLNGTLANDSNGDRFVSKSSIHSTSTERSQYGKMICNLLFWFFFDFKAIFTFWLIWTFFTVLMRTVVSVLDSINIQLISTFRINFFVSISFIYRLIEKKNVCVCECLQSCAMINDVIKARYFWTFSQFFPFILAF